MQTYITGYYKQPELSEHTIYIRQINEYGEVFYSKFTCYNIEVYTKMMEAEFKLGMIL